MCSSGHHVRNGGCLSACRALMIRSRVITGSRLPIGVSPDFDMNSPDSKQNQERGCFLKIRRETIRDNRYIIVHYSLVLQSASLAIIDSSSFVIIGVAKFIARGNGFVSLIPVHIVLVQAHSTLNTVYAHRGRISPPAKLVLSQRPRHNPILLWITVFLKVAYCGSVYSVRIVCEFSS